MTEPKPQYNEDSDSFELEISTGEERLLRQIRRGIQGAGRRPYVATIIVNDGIWSIWTGQPSGQVRDKDLTPDK